MTTPPLPWTVERVRTLEQLWLDGLSAAEIARSLEAVVTRNAVIGKAHRLGLARRWSTGLGRCGRAVRPPPPQVRRPGPMIVARSRLVAASVVPTTRPVDLPRLATAPTVTAIACRWPSGDRSDAGLALCGLLAVRGADCVAYAGAADRGAAASKHADRRLVGDRP